MSERAERRAVPILLYHSVSSDPPEWIAPYTVTRETFARHLDLVVASGRPVLDVAGFVAWCRDPSGDVPPVVITFDDGYTDFATDALPELDARGLPSTLFVTTGALRDASGPRSMLPPADMLTLDQVRDLDRAGVEIGAHGQTHVQLDTVGMRRVADDVERSRDVLEDALGHRVANFAYAHGYSSPAVREVVQRAGFDSACAVRNTFSSAADHRFALGRWMLHADTPDDTFRSWLDPTRVAPPFRETALTVGWRWVRRVRTRLPIGAPA